MFAALLLVLLLVLAAPAGLLAGRQPPPALAHKHRRPGLILRRSSPSPRAVSKLRPPPWSYRGPQPPSAAGPQTAELIVSRPPTARQPASPDAPQPPAVPVASPPPTPPPPQVLPPPPQVLPPAPQVPPPRPGASGLSRRAPPLPPFPPNAPDAPPPPNAGLLTFNAPEPQGCYQFVCDGPKGCFAVDKNGGRFGLTLLFDVNGFDPVSCVSGGSSSYRFVAILADSGCYGLELGVGGAPTILPPTDDGTCLPCQGPYATAKYDWTGLYCGSEEAVTVYDASGFPAPDMAPPPGDAAVVFGG
ncbi:hypothetical protein HYH02_011096 [Chlamydomonas schloesseri]|uniref:Pherophorin domain-containing protein n=1 Tax=Chlamydomonas schloesseri TaxID=2026947 RepID=A0A835T7J4_9CHLO|nr:hypothetical protein HYH02_011096 [Chlamydomonas schloesseri]|eukprot:KAG2437718.1 hypothetical protein HYH02_011096 [Chlamydomonas schloesseri]